MTGARLLEMPLLNPPMPLACCQGGAECSLGWAEPLGTGLWLKNSLDVLAGIGLNASDGPAIFSTYANDLCRQASLCQQGITSHHLPPQIQRPQ